MEKSRSFRKIARKLHNAKSLFKYRIVKTTYRSRTEWEDGPGSLTNIVSDIEESFYVCGPYKEPRSKNEWGTVRSKCEYSSWISYTSKVERWDYLKEEWIYFTYIPERVELVEDEDCW